MRNLSFSLALAALVPGVVAQCIPASGTSLAQSGVLFDAWTAAYPIGFAFPFNGSTYTDFYVSDHSTVALTNAGTPAAPAGGSFLWGPLTTNLTVNGPFLAPYWSDHQIGSAPGADIFVDNSSGTSCTITWFQHQTYLNQNPAFTVSCTLFNDGRIVYAYDDNVNNNGSTFGALNAIVGISEGGGATLPAASDLSAVGVSATTTVFEEFVTTGAGVPNPNFDLSSSQLEFVPTNPGWVIVPSSIGCAANRSYGVGCGGNPVGGAHYELFTAFDLGNTGHTYLWTGGGYLLLDGAGAIVPAVGAPTAFTDDNTQPVALGFSMPSPAGSITDISLCSNGWLSFAPTTATDLGETVAGLLANPRLAFLWDDLNPGVGGSITIDQVGGTQCVITFNAVPEFAAGGANTVQVVLSSTGDIEVRYGACSLLDGMVGVSPGNSANDLGSVDYSALGSSGPVQIDTGVAPFSDSLELASTAPVLGGNWDLTTSGIDPISPIAITFFGLLAVDPGLDLGFLGAPGCNAHISPIAGDLTGLSIGGTATVALPIPANPTLVGAIVTAQSVCLTLGNALNLYTSNGVEGTLGN